MKCRSQWRALHNLALAAVNAANEPEAANSGNVVKTKYKHIHFYKDSGKFGTWSRPYNGCKQKRIYIGSFRSMYLSKRAQDRAYLKFKLNTELHFQESDYVLDEELRNTMKDLDFVKILRAESRDFYKLRAPSKCLQSYYMPPSEDEETQVIMGTFSKSQSLQAKQSASAVTELPATKLSRRKHRVKMLCVQARKLRSKQPRRERQAICVPEEEVSKDVKTAPSLAPNGRDIFLDYVSLVRKARSPRKSAVWKTIDARSTAAAATESQAAASAILLTTTNTLSSSERSSNIMLQNSVKESNSEEAMQIISMIRTKAIPTMDQSSIPFKKRIALRQLLDLE